MNFSQQTFAGQHIHAAIDLLKPLSTGVHDTEPWHFNTLCPVNVLDNEAYDDDPWNEWGTHKPLPGEQGKSALMLEEMPYVNECEHFNSRLVIKYDDVYECLDCGDEFTKKEKEDGNRNV